MSIDLVCSSCKKERSAADSFCSKCGHYFISLRSENEIKAELELLQKIQPSNLMELSMFILVETVLRWVMGSPVSAARMLQDTFDKHKEDHNGPTKP